MSHDDYDVIVIGAGPVGENLADRTAQAGMRTAVIEGDLVGGECSYRACMPSKALLRPAAALRAAKRVSGARKAVTGGVDVAAALRRRDTLVHNWRDDAQVRWLDSVGIDLVRGHGRLDGPRRVTVEAPDGSVHALTATHAVAVCTGSSPAVPDIPGLREIAPWTSRDATTTHEIPASLAIIGGGVVACELATAFSALGARVTMAVRGRGLLERMEPFVGACVREALEDAGVVVRTGVEVTDAHRTERNAVLNLSNGGRIVAAQVLVATGRSPNTRDLGLDTVGLVPGESVAVDETMRAPGIDGLYAAGDVNGRAPLTHQGKYQARAAGDAIAARAAGRPVDDARWGAQAATADHGAVPQVVFTEPEVAAVGLTEPDARARGIGIRVLDVDLGTLAGAATHADGYRGEARAIVDDARDVLLGATFVGPDVAELAHAATIAIVGEVPLEHLWHAVPAFPTLSELWLRWLEQDGR